MRTQFDFSPLFRSTIGFDRIFDMLASADEVVPADDWPPYDIVKTGEDSYRITMAVAGFSDDELDVTYQPRLLTVSGAKAGEDEGEYLHHGMGGRAFERRFELADYVKVAGATLKNGLLGIDLERQLPEEMKPRRIDIRSADALPAAAARQISGGRAAA